MANIQSAKKRSRQANSRNSLKSSQRASMRTMIRNVEDAIKENDVTKAKAVSYTHLTLPTILLV